MELKSRILIETKSKLFLIIDFTLYSREWVRNYMNIKKTKRLKDIHKCPHGLFEIGTKASVVSGLCVLNPVYKSVHIIVKSLHPINSRV